MSDLPDSPNKRPRWLVVCLSLIPVWLILSAAVAVWWSFYSDDKEEEERNQRFAMEMSVERIADDMRKLVEVIGPRDADHPEALMRAAAMIDGTLGPSNTGYQIQRIPGPNEAPIIRASLEQSKNGGRSIWVVAAYDSDSISERSFAMESSAVASLIAAAQAMSRDELPTNIHFQFIPHGNNPFFAVEEQAKALKSTMQQPAFVIFLDYMCLGTNLIFNRPLTSGNIVSLEPIDSSSTQGLGIMHENTIMSFEAETFRGVGLKVVEIRASGNDGSDCKAENIAISTGKLVEWLRRAARLEAAK